MEHGEDDAGLAGLRVLVVEDEVLIAMEVGELLSDRGATVLGPASSAWRALALIRECLPDVAVLDVELPDGTAAPVAEMLRTRGIPFVVVTGLAEMSDPALLDAPRVDKPFGGNALVRAVAFAAGR